MTRDVLLVDDDAAVREALCQTLELADMRPIPAGSFVAAKDRISQRFDGVILSDIRMPGRDGFHLLDYAHAQDPDLPVILLTGEGDIPMAVQAMTRGAFGFLEKPCASADLVAVVERALKSRALVLELRRMRHVVESGDPAARMIFGTSNLAEGLRARVRRAARTEGDVLVTGQPGTGISKVSEVIHLSSLRSKAPFVKRAAAGLSPEGLEEALRDAGEGSLFLDEIVQLPAQTQLSLGEALEQPGRARLIAGATRDLLRAVDEGAFNADLYFRLDVMQVRIPALAERPEDIPEMFRRYVDQAAEQAGLRPPDVTPEIVADLMSRDWPGNARALMSEAMRLVMGVNEQPRADASLGLAEQMAQVEQSLLRTALRRAGGSASDAAQALKLPRKTFYDKLARYGIKPETFRS
ncbi:MULTISPECIES: sigma-54-dependent transcriptional regulator [unclassified Sulfitobacter]|jgi:two-component system C4-dicarboxylate transport response regulator DctD|uniref:sigma-54-dependent transcriptional regulator n=1 Tax=unclassified Sulfitobacter TaxID=196795 RepID=UPI0007C2B4AE|nr:MULTISPECIES: sigma-54 dependent transcriptional regulator [unclassified Sulfitobacter]KZY06051.1 sigma-54-dependent Fis family transcriptional regulator [Sulfitobacter sp. HI0023]KZY23787.1 sigma-54-dependent Fis family transcriptional regulator [Sulfitobacter sp. HI0040]KZZ69947.1 sigma-54-dependent Fis family transcriptional regulator [Sulfitobacter sp. HI0129]